MSTDTPRTDAILMECPSHLQEVALANLAHDLELELAHSLANQVTAQAEIERLKEQYKSATELVARMHEAAVGEIRGPIISVIEDIKAVKERAEESEAEVKRLKTDLRRLIVDEFWKNQKQAVLVYHQELADELDQIKVREMCQRHCDHLNAIKRIVKPEAIN